MKKYLLAALVGALALGSVAWAKPEQADKERAEKRADKKEFVSSSESAKIKKNMRAISIYGELVSVSGTAAPATMVVKVTKVNPEKAKNWEGTYPEVGKEVTVAITDKTNLRRAFLAKALLVQMSVGDEVRVVAKLSEAGVLTAQLVKDSSIRAGSKAGVIESIDAQAKTFVMKKGDKSFTVKVTAETKMKMSIDPVDFTGLKVGAKVKVQGVINTRLNTITANMVKVLKLPETAPVTQPATTPAV